MKYTTKQNKTQQKTRKYLTKKLALVSMLSKDFFVNKVSKYGVKIYKALENGVYRIYDENLKFIGIGEIKENKLKRDICV